MESAAALPESAFFSEQTIALLESALAEQVRGRRLHVNELMGQSVRVCLAYNA